MAPYQIPAAPVNVGSVHVAHQSDGSVVALVDDYGVIFKKTFFADFNEAARYSYAEAKNATDTCVHDHGEGQL